jgi:hypothetical protein
MDSAAKGPFYQFEGFVLDLTRGILSNAKGEELPLRRKSFDLLPSDREQGPAAGPRHDRSGNLVRCHGYR